MKSQNIMPLLALLAFSACQKDIQQQPEPKIAATSNLAARVSAPANRTVNLSVTVDDASANQILSDNNGAYINGKDRVDAQILSSDGNFYMNTNNNTVKSPLRIMNFLPDYPGLGLEGKRNYSLRTRIETGIWLQDMDINTSQNVGFRVWGVQQNGIVEWKLLFRNGVEDDPMSITDYAKVTRTSADEWTIEPASSVGVTAATARLIDGSTPPNSLGMGYYVVPFKLTLARLAK